MIHHLGDKPKFYREAARISRDGGLLCTVTDSEDIIRHREILSGYFPETVDVDVARYPRISRLKEWMAEAGFGDLATVTVEEPYEITNAQPFCDRAFSALLLIPEEAWRTGLEYLERDLKQEPIRGSSRYICLWGRKGVRRTANSQRGAWRSSGMAAV